MPMLTIPLLSQAEPPCGPAEEAGGLCTAILDLTNNEALARAGDIFLAKPAKIAIILLVAAVVSRLAKRAIRRFTKGLFDRTAALFGLVLLSPLLLGIAVAVRCTSHGPVLFRQERIGRCGETFTMLKFRSMVQDAHRMVEELAADSDRDNDVLFKMRDDPRVTRVGRFLRRYSLDELPQLINVLRGDMSLVGPRPPLAEEVERYGSDMHRRFLVKPGLTGLWQVSGRSDLSWDDSVRIDVRYVENWSLALDLMIIFKTVGAVLRGSGAY